VSGRIAILAILVTGLALPAPSAFAHGNQFICARLTVGDDGRVALELTADHGDNPNIADATEARQALRDCLQVCIGDQRFPLEHFGRLSFAERQHYSEDSPVPLASEPGPHRLVTAVWSAYLPGQRLVFAAKEHTPLDVVLWRAGEVPEPGHSRWMLLIAGDRSPEFTTGRTSPAAVPLIITGLVTAAMLLIGVGFRRQRIDR
jgi:hypothetical protein